MVVTVFRKAACFLTLGLLLATAGVSGAQELSLSTNFADYAQSGTLNLEAGYGLARHWSVSAGVKYNPYSFGSGGDTHFRRQRLYCAGARWWPWHIYSGWWLSARLQYQEFATTDEKGNTLRQLPFSGRSGGPSTEGDRYGAGLLAGYSQMIGRHFNLDFGAGFWGGWSSYVTYTCPTCGRISSSASGSFFLPADVIFALNYIF